MVFSVFHWPLNILILIFPFQPVFLSLKDVSALLISSDDRSGSGGANS